MKLEKFLNENYRKCKDFFIESKYFILFAFGIFGLAYIVGFIYPEFYREEIFLMLGELISEVEGKGALELSGFIFLNNMKVAFMAIVLGIFAGIFPLIAGVFNGYLIGFVLNEAVAAEGLGIVWRLFPHGIFELPAIIFSLGFGIKIGYELFTVKDVRDNIKRNYRESIRFYLFVIFPLLLLAAVIEGILIWGLN